MSPRMAKDRKRRIRQIVPRHREPASSSVGVLQSTATLIATIGPPVTVVTALLVYFGWARSDKQARYMGLDVSLFGYSTQDYVLRGITTLFLPLLAVVAVAFAWLVLHRRALVALDGPKHVVRNLRIAGLYMATTGLVAIGVALVAAFAEWRWALLGAPLTVATGVVVGSYGAWLARHAADPRSDDRLTLGHRALRGLLIGGAVTLAVFWELSSFAGVVGRGNAQQIASTLHELPRVMVFSSAPLGIQAPGVTEELIKLPDGAKPDDKRFRTTGLRLLVRSGGRMFLVHDGWSPQAGSVVVMTDDPSLRWQFSR